MVLWDFPPAASQISPLSYSPKQEEDLLEEEKVNFSNHEVHVDTKNKMNEKVDRETAEEIDSQKSENIHSYPSSHAFLKSAIYPKSLMTALIILLPSLACLFNKTHRVTSTGLILPAEKS